jgi:hypothetical protein
MFAAEYSKYGASLAVCLALPPPTWASLITKKTQKVQTGSVKSNHMVPRDVEPKESLILSMNILEYSVRHSV